METWKKTEMLTSRTVSTASLPFPVSRSVVDKIVFWLVPYEFGMQTVSLFYRYQHWLHYDTLKERTSTILRLWCKWLLLMSQSTISIYIYSQTFCSSNFTFILFRQSVSPPAGAAVDRWVWNTLRCETGRAVTICLFWSTDTNVWCLLVYLDRGAFSFSLQWGF